MYEIFCRTVVFHVKLSLCQEGN